MRVDDVPQPDTPVARAAVEVAAAYCSPALLAHCRRSYLWAASFGIDRGIAFDEELLFVSALLHDIGLTAPFDSAAIPFEEAGGAVAWVFGAGAGWPAERRTRAAEVIVRHMGGEVDPAVDAEGHLLRLATGLDISGRGADLWPADLRAEVARRHPRGSLDEEFLRLFEDQAGRKPDGAAASAIRSGLAGRMARNTLHALEGDGGTRPAGG